MHHDKPRAVRLSPAATVLVMGLVVAIPAALTFLRVEDPGKLQVGSSDPTPLGYTWSLLLFFVPLGLLVGWFLKQKDLRFQRRALLWTVPIVSGLGFVLDILFGTRFFVFPNRGATLGLMVPVVGGTVPVEEFLFYISGILVVLMTYLWCDESWVARYNDQDYGEGLKRAGRLLRFHTASAWTGLALFSAATLYKCFLTPEPGLPSYFTFLLVVSIVPSMGLFRSVQPYINWRAFSITFFFILLVSLLWEATLALPYGWWGYQREAMLGIFIGAWSGLPLEAVLVWGAVSYTTVIFYEVIKVWLGSGEKARTAFLGSPAVK